MSSTWINKPVVFFGKRIYILFAAVLSVPVWLAAYTYIHAMQLAEDEAVSTGVTMTFFTGVFAGRYLAETWPLHLHFKPRMLVAGMVLFVVVCFSWIFIHADNPQQGRFLNLLLYLLPFVAMSLASGVLIKTIKAIAQRELGEAKTAAAHSKSELQLLQSQLSPHFLFNTLNNMYGLSLSQHEKVPSLLLRLSELLRYSVYGANETFVTLKDEVEYINNYIEFEKIRLGGRLVLKTDIEPPTADMGIAPMLLIVFIENAFKHAKNTGDQRIYISISLKIWNGMVLFSVKNSFSKHEQTFNKNSGFGLDNVRKRLELLYKENYKLDIEQGDDTYSVMLHVKMNKL